MNTYKVLIGGGRSSGKTTLLNLLVSGKIASPFPRGIKGRSSMLNTVEFHSDETPGKEDVEQTAVRISTSGVNHKQIDIRTSSPGCTDILLSAACDLGISLLGDQSDEEKTSLSLEIHAKCQTPPGLISEICTDALADFTNKDSLNNQEGPQSIPVPKIYVHLTPAIKPLAHVERQAIIKFLSLDIPVIMLVNKCDLVDSEDDFDEIFNLARTFSCKDCKERLPYYMVSLAFNNSPSNAILGALETRDLVRHAVTFDLGKDF